MLNKDQKIKLFSSALEKFETDEVRDFAKDLFLLMPEDSIMLPSSSSQKYHNYTQCQLFGNLKHVLMVGNICNYLLGLEQYQELVPEPIHRDCVRLSAYAHDGVKYGWNGSKYTLFTHPLISAEWVRTAEVNHPIEQELREFSARMIESHSGQWDTSNRSKEILPKPVTEGEKLIHICDYLSSRADIDMSYPDELDQTINEIINDMKDNYKIDFGKYNGQTLKSVYAANHGYFSWLSENGGIKEPIKTLITFMG